MAAWYLCGVSHIKPERKKSNAMQWSARIEECLPLLFGAECAQQLRSHIPR